VPLRPRASAIQPRRPPLGRKPWHWSWRRGAAPPDTMASRTRCCKGRHTWLHAGWDRSCELPGRASTRSQDLKPLQLSDCKTRLAGALWASIVGPQIEPHRTTFQTAKRAGNCGSSLRAVVRHIGCPLMRTMLGCVATPGVAKSPGTLAPSQAGGTPRRSASSAPRLPPFADAVGAIVQAAGRDHPDLGTAVTFADQGNACERLGHEWTLLVRTKWGIPFWLRRLAMGLTHGRLVRAMYKGTPGTARPVHWSVGVGGPARLLLWSVC